MGDSVEGATDARTRRPSLADAITPLVALAGLIAASLALFGMDALDGPIQVALVLCCGLVALSIGSSWTTAATAIAVVVFLVLGLATTDLASTVETTSDLDDLNQIFAITPWALLPLVLLAYLSIRKVPASLALMASALFAGALAAFLQPEVVADFVPGDGNVVIESVKAVWMAMANGFSIDSGIADIDRLLSRGGMDSMLLTIWLIIGAVTFGAILEEFGPIDRLVLPMTSAARSTGRLFLTVFACAFGLNVVAGDQYIALVLPCRVFRAEFARRGLAPTNLSRIAADSGTVTSPLVPWNSCGAFMAATLGVSTLLYLPYAVFNIASPLLSVAYGFTGFRIERTDLAEEAA